MQREIFRRDSLRGSFYVSHMRRKGARDVRAKRKMKYPYELHSVNDVYDSESSSESESEEFRGD